MVTPIGLAEAFRLGGGSLGLFCPPLALDRALGPRTQRAFSQGSLIGYLIICTSNELEMMCKEEGLERDS